MFWIYKEEELQFVWDDDKKIMYQIENGEVTEIDPTIEQLTRFRPYLEFVEKTDVRPKILLRL